MIPKIIWQTYELEHKNLPKKAKNFSSSWQHLNPDWDYVYVSEKNRLNFVKEYFGEEWYTIYKSYKINVMRADLWRYMCLYIKGGLYSDLDIVCKKPIESWLNLDTGFMFSEEPNNPGYTQMIFASEPKNVFLKNILDAIKEQYYKKNIYSNLIDAESKEVGYIVFTNSILKTINSGEKNFIAFLGKDAEQIHYNCIKHYRAGNTEVFGKKYKQWQKEMEQYV
jgi:mannosyltransferase OCH1-like enzyme